MKYEVKKSKVYKGRTKGRNKKKSQHKKRGCVVSAVLIEGNV